LLAFLCVKIRIILVIGPVPTPDSIYFGAKRLRIENNHVVSFGIFVKIDDTCPKLSFRPYTCCASMVVYMKQTIIRLLHTRIGYVNNSPTHESMWFMISFVCLLDVIPLIKPVEKVILANSWPQIFTIDS
jgi:hypothetical protein